MGVRSLALIAVFCFFPGRSSSALQWVIVCGGLALSWLMGGGLESTSPSFLIENAIGIGLIVAAAAFVALRLAESVRFAVYGAGFVAAVALLLAFARRELAIVSVVLMIFILAARMLRKRRPKPSDDREQQAEADPEDEPVPLQSRNAEPIPIEEAGGEPVPLESALSTEVAQQEAAFVGSASAREQANPQRARGQSAGAEPIPIARAAGDPVPPESNSSEPVPHPARDSAETVSSVADAEGRASEEPNSRPSREPPRRWPEAVVQFARVVDMLLDLIRGAVTFLVEGFERFGTFAEGPGAGIVLALPMIVVTRETAWLEWRWLVAASISVVYCLLVQVVMFGIGWIFVASRRGSLRMSAQEVVALTRRMGLHLESFAPAGLWSIFFIGLLRVWLRVFGIELDLFGAIVGLLGAWISILLVARWLLLRSDRAFVARMIAQSTGRPDRTTDEARAELAAEVASHRLRAGLQDAMQMALSTSPPTGSRRPDAAAGGDDVDVAVAVWYQPVQALVWALPAAGFIGTSWHLRTIVQSASQQVSAGEAPGGSAVFLSAVASSLLLVCVALSLSVISYIATAALARSDANSVLEYKFLLLQVEGRQRVGDGT